MRLDEILNCVVGADCSILADIGTDHAQIPIEAIKRKLAKKAIACDIAPGPLEKGKRNVVNEGLSKFIELRLGDGLSPILQNEADVVVIAGMGGMRILKIIAYGLYKICNANLILQPQHDTSKLRRGLYDLGVKIHSEHLAKEGERFYEILCAKKICNMNRKHSESGTCSNGHDAPLRPEKNSDVPTEKDFFLGSYKGDFASQFYLQKKQKIEKYIHHISDENEKKQAHKQLAWLNKALAEGIDFP